MDIITAIAQGTVEAISKAGFDIAWSCPHERATIKHKRGRETRVYFNQDHAATLERGGIRYDYANPAYPDNLISDIKTIQDEYS